MSSCVILISQSKGISTGVLISVPRKRGISESKGEAS